MYTQREKQIFFRMAKKDSIEIYEKSSFTECYSSAQQNREKSSLLFLKTYKIWLN